MILKSKARNSTKIRRQAWFLFNLVEN